ncbi:MAG: hydroxylamine oxidase [Deltaproteobacteria bacterium]|nr:hydroxylamine oxidase [Deltaproteobacteria bacterium]
MLKSLGSLAVVLALALAAGAVAAEAPMSEDTEACIGCHEEVTPGIVADWRRSRHARTTPRQALALPEPERRVSAKEVPEGLGAVVVGCAECHTRSPDAHPDTFDHNGFRVHIVVTPADCATCHPQEREQYGRNLMANAHDNLMANELYAELVAAVAGPTSYDGEGLTVRAPDELTVGDACLACHGTRVTVDGMETRDTAMGEMEFPRLRGWPNQGVGRINPDGTKGACTSCHTRHRFSIEEAREPDACEQCHKGPDVPAYKVYEVSKHNAVYQTAKGSWNLEAVPWVVGRDFTAPTCATCHASLVTTPGGEVLAPRTHEMADRLRYRLFGLPYATAHPRSGDTTVIRNQAGLALPSELTGEPAAAFLIDEAEQARREARMRSVCSGCHSGQWTRGHFERLANTVRTTNALTLEATKILLRAWESGLARGPGQGGNPFDEAIEKMWVEQWLFYANSTRFASAMAGADYGVFANGRWYLQKNLALMKDWLGFLSRPGVPPVPGER